MIRKRNRFFRAVPAWFFLGALILSLAGCNFFGLPEYELSITVEEGVTGTPVSGVQVLADLTVVEYAYTPLNALHTVEVFADTARLAASGTVTMYKNITLSARLFDIRAAWDMIVYNADSTTKATFTITFSGADILGGTFQDSRGHAGTWKAASNVIKIVYSDWESYSFTGTLFDMNGSWSNGDVTGTWSASRAQ
jgi:hypothetical protein